MRKFLIFFVCIFTASLAFFYVTGKSQSRIPDCIAFTFCEATPSTAEGCKLTIKRTKCDGSKGSSYGGCFNQGCIADCACACETTGGTITGATSSWTNSCTGVVSGERKICAGAEACASPTPTPC